MKPPPPKSCWHPRTTCCNILIEPKVIAHEPQPFQLQCPLKPTKSTCFKRFPKCRAKCRRCSHEEEYQKMLQAHENTQDIACTQGQCVEPLSSIHHFGKQNKWLTRKRSENWLGSPQCKTTITNCALKGSIFPWFRGLKRASHVFKGRG